MALTRTSTSVAFLCVACFFLLTKAARPLYRSSVVLPDQAEWSDQVDVDRSMGHTPSEHYLLSYFINNGQDGLHLAHSRDGLEWSVLNGGKPLVAPLVGEQRLMRDPSICAGPDGVFHMVWTTSWTGNTLGYARSSDLIRWSEQQAIAVMAHEPGCKNVWAPELFWDEERRVFLVVWSSTVHGRFEETADSSENGHNHRLYFAETRDFSSFSPTRLLYDPGYNVIDGSIIRDADGTHLLFFKDERLLPEPQKSIRVAAAPRPQGPYGPPSAPIAGGDVWVEGPSVLHINGSLVVYFDCYMEKRYGAVVARAPLFGERAATHSQGAGAPLASYRWQDISDRLRIPAVARHGAVLRVPPRVAARLLALAPGSVSSVRLAAGEGLSTGPSQLMAATKTEHKAGAETTWTYLRAAFWSQVLLLAAYASCALFLLTR
eukprot:jgi/Mesvir1/10515/Mv21763-RA.2